MGFASQIGIAVPSRLQSFQGGVLPRLLDALNRPSAPPWRNTGTPACALSRRQRGAACRTAKSGCATEKATPEPKSWPGSKAKRPEIQPHRAANSRRSNCLVRRLAMDVPDALKPPSRAAPTWGLSKSAVFDVVNLRFSLTFVSGGQSRYPWVGAGKKRQTP